MQIPIIMYSDDFIIKLSKKIGNSFYLFHSGHFNRNLKTFKREFENVYTNVKPAYSFKTNYMPEICRIVRSEGWLAEVVSDFEYEIARKTGFNGKDIIFNGPLKEKPELYRAFYDGAMVQFESFEEIEILRSYLRDYPEEKVKCSVRCNFEIGDPARSRFGFDAENRDAYRAFTELFELDRCIPVGAHCHFSTSHRGLDSFERRTKKMIGFAKNTFNNHNTTPEFINIGGGFFGEIPQSIKSLFNVEIPSFSEYAGVVGGLMKRHYPDESVILILEPGASVVANTMSYICGVQSIKRIGSKPVIVTTGSIYNIRPTLSSHQIDFRVIKISKERLRVENAIVGGYTCMESDIINNAYSGEIAVGDLLLFECTGAYNTVFKPPFIKGAPPILLVDNELSTPNFTLLKEQETTDYLLAPYVTPVRN